MMTASLALPACGAGLREANTQRPAWPLCSKRAAYRLTHFSSVSFWTSRIFIRCPLSLVLCTSYRVVAGRCPPITKYKGPRTKDESDRFRAALAGADADAVLQRQ